MNNTQKRKVTNKNGPQKKKITNTNVHQKKKITKKIKKKKKLKFNFFKFLRNIIIFAIAIFVIVWILTPDAKPATTPSKQPASTSTNPSTTANPVVAQPASPVTEYKNAQHTQMNNIFRFNQNLYMAMSSNNVVNIYPDSQNGVNELNSNLTAYANKLDAQTVRDDSVFISELTLKNNAFINAVIAYNNEVTSKSPNQATLTKLNSVVLTNYNAVNAFMNSNLGLFK